MKTQFKYDFAYSRDFLLEQFTSEAFYQKRMEMEGIEGVHIVAFEDSEQQMSLTMKRELEIRLNGMPRFMQKALEKVVTESASVSTHIQWDKQSAEGSIGFEGGSLPGEVDLQMRIVENNNKSATVKGTLRFNVTIPVIGKRIEKFAMPKVEKVIQRDFEKMEEYFKSL